MKERFVMIDAMSINNDIYYKAHEEGYITTTKNKEKAIVVDSISEGLDMLRHKVFYAPIFEPI